MQARRDFLRQVLPVGAATAIAFKTEWLERVVSAGAALADRPANEVAADEGYWREIQQAFTLDRTIINLNNGYTCPSPRVVHESLKRYLDMSNLRSPATPARRCRSLSLDSTSAPATMW
jgi:isopenicillin-N epimerase